MAFSSRSVDINFWDFPHLDVISYTALMKSYVNRPKGGEKALELLREMDRQYRDGNIRAKADAQAISIAIDACVKSGLLDEAWCLLDDVEDSTKNRVMFNTLISAYKLEGRGEKAEDLLRRMDHLSKVGYKSCSPDSTSYAMCIYAVSMSYLSLIVMRCSVIICQAISCHSGVQVKLERASFDWNGRDHYLMKAYNAIVMVMSC